MDSDSLDDGIFDESTTFGDSGCYAGFLSSFGHFHSTSGYSTGQVSVISSPGRKIHTQNVPDFSAGNAFEAGHGEPSIDERCMSDTSIEKPPWTKEDEYALFRLARRLAKLHVESTNKQLMRFYQFPVVSRCSYDEVAANLDGVVGGASTNCRTIPLVSHKKPKKPEKMLADFCQFCKNNDQANVALWSSHRCKDQHGNTQCPILRRHVCEVCSQTGDKAHTIRYCELKKSREMQRMEQTSKWRHSLL